MAGRVLSYKSDLRSDVGLMEVNMADIPWSDMGSDIENYQKTFQTWICLIFFCL